MARRSHRLARTFVRRSSDERLERLLGGRRAQRALFSAMERAYVPGALDGFTGEIGWSLRHRGATSEWVLKIARGEARARREAAEHPAVHVRVGVAVLARVGVGEVDPMRALLAGDLDVEGDFGVAARLGELFGRPARAGRGSAPG